MVQFGTGGWSGFSLSRNHILISGCLSSSSDCACSSFPSGPVGAARVPDTEITLQSCACGSLCVCVCTSHLTEFMQNWTSTGIRPPSLDHHHHHQLIFTLRSIHPKKRKAVDSSSLCLFTFCFPFVLCFDWIAYYVSMTFKCNSESVSFQLDLPN